jgi:hypothetical protein
MNFDEIDKKTYNMRGAKTDRSGWGKRQATLVLYIFADGRPELISTRLRDKVCLA